MIILGIDPGFAIVGWGVLCYDGVRFSTLAYGAIRTPAKTRVEDRLAQIDRDLSRIIDRYRPTQMAVEELFFNTNTTSPWRRRVG